MYWVDQCRLETDIQRQVSSYALKKVVQQFKLATSKDLAPCTHRFTTSMGLPCAHFIKAKLDQKQSLSIEDVNPRWHLCQASLPEPATEDASSFEELLGSVVIRYNDMHLPQQQQLRAQVVELASMPAMEILPPRMAEVRGRPSMKRMSQSSTRRDPSGFEYVEKSNGKRKKYQASRCSKCGNPGHNARTCTSTVTASSSSTPPTVSQPVRHLLRPDMQLHMQAQMQTQMQPQIQTWMAHQPLFSMLPPDWMSGR